MPLRRNFIPARSHRRNRAWQNNHEQDRRIYLRGDGTRAGAYWQRFAVHHDCSSVPDRTISLVQLQVISERFMSLTSRFSSQFDSAIRNRGRSYYTSGQVRITQGDDLEVIATVRGSENYRVILSIEGKTLIVFCTCPYFDQDVCKHIWATLMAAEARGLLTATPEPTHMRMSDDDEDDED